MTDSAVTGLRAPAVTGSAARHRAAHWEAVPHPVVVLDRAGAVLAISDPAGQLLAASIGRSVTDCAPDWLAAAHRDLVATTADPDVAPVVAGRVADRVVTARATPLANGDVAWWLIPDTASDAERVLAAAQEALTRERQRAAFLDEASALLTASLNVDRVMAATAQLAARHLADAAVVIGPAVGREVPVFCSGPDGEVGQRSVHADPSAVVGLSEALRGFPPIPSRWIDAATVPPWLVPDGFTGTVGSVVITPLPGHGVPAGALVLLRRATEATFDEGEEVFARLFAARAGAALSAARLYAEQAAVTRTLMQDLLPPVLHRLHGIEFAGGYRASEDHHLIGGDFYDVHPAADPDGETLVVLGDVCGKGLDAAVLTGKIRNTLEALAPLAHDHAGVLALLNSALRTSHHSRFATVVLASVARRDSGVQLRLTSAGHMPPLIVRDDGSVEEADTRGMLIGVMPEVSSRSFETSLAPGETCLLYTDGVTEAHGGPLGSEMFGEQRLATALAECAGLPAEAVVERIMMLATEWVGTRTHDDIAVVAITAPRRTHLSAVDGHTAGRYTA